MEIPLRLTPKALRSSFLEFVGTELDCQAFDGRLAFDTPLYYPDGDSVVVYVWEKDGRFEVADQGGGYEIIMKRPGLRRKVFSAAAHEICNGLAVKFIDGLVVAHSPREEIADTVWRVATASSRIAEAVTFLRPERHKEDLFTAEVEAALREKKIPTERSKVLMGASGHEHRPTIYLPTSHAVVEPIAGDAPWHRATSVYAEFGDLAKANGHRLMAVVDDRAGETRREFVKLLAQVSDVASWSNRDQWVRGLA